MPIFVGDPKWTSLAPPLARVQPNSSVLEGQTCVCVGVMAGDVDCQGNHGNGIPMIAAATMKKRFP